MGRLLTATLLVSAAAIAFEILLMRLLSIVQWHHFAWMIISLALLGYGTSGTAIALGRRWLEPRFGTAFAVSALLFSIAMPLTFVLGQRVPFNALQVVWEPRQFLHLAALYLLFMVPFLFAASCIGMAFSFRASMIGRIYFFDLLGAGLGALLIIGVLFLVPAPQALVLLAALAWAASVLAGLTSPARRVLITAQVLWFAVLLAILPAGRIDLRISEFKGLSQALQVVDSRIVYESSSPLGLLTVVESPRIPFRHAPGLSFTTRFLPPEQLALFTDGDGMSVITRRTGEAEQAGYLGDVTSALPFKLLQDPEVLVLGAGTGGDVMLALHHGAEWVDAVELNPRVSGLLAERYAEFTGQLYADERVRQYTAEARGFVAQTEARYDLVHLGLLDSFGVSGSGVQALNENYLYTVEAMQTYLEILKPGGILSITRWLRVPPRDSLKLAATAVEALRRLGVDDPGGHLFMIRSWNTITLLVGRDVFSAGRTAALQDFAQSRFFDTAWYPSMPASEANRYNRLDRPYLYEGIQEILGADADHYFESYKFRVEPASDDRPYFFHFFKWRVLPEVLALRERGGAGLVEWGYLVLVGTLVQAVLAGALLILLPLALVERAWPNVTTGQMGAYFFLLGLAFLFVEMAFIQKFILFLSHPLYSVAVVLAGFLVFAGMGSAWSGRVALYLEARGYPPVRVAVAGIAAFTLTYILVLPVIFGHFMGTSDAVRIGVTLVLIAPLAFCMGLPFPLGLSHIAGRAPDFIPWAWGLNGFASVISAALATLLAIRFGFTAVLLLALVFYAAASMLLRR